MLKQVKVLKNPQEIINDELKEIIRHEVFELLKNNQNKHFEEVTRSEINLILNSACFWKNKDINFENSKTLNEDEKFILEIQKIYQREYQIQKLFQKTKKEENPEKRQNIIKKVLSEEFNKSFESFLNFLDSLSQKDLPVTVENLELPYILAHEIYILALEVVKKDEKKYKGWMKFLEEKTKRTHKEYDFKGAGLPRASKKIEENTQSILKLLKNNLHSFDIIIEAFKEKIHEIWGKNYEGFYTNGTNLAFTKLQSVFLKKYPNSQIFYNGNEYLSMPFDAEISEKREERKHINKVEIGDLKDLNEEKLVNFYFETLGKNKKKYFDKFSTQEPLVFFFSSEFRAGKKKLDIHKIIKLIRKKAKKEKLDIHIWVDAAQDNRFFTNHHDDKKNPHQNEDFDIGDAIFYSKRLGGTGKGLALLNQNKYPELGNIGYSLSEACGGGLDPKNLLEVFGGLSFAKRKIAHTLGHLTKGTSLWRYNPPEKALSNPKPKIQTYINGEVQKGLDLFESSEILKKYFNFFIQDIPEENYEWKNQTILNLTQKQDIELDINRLQKNLEAGGFNLDNFNLELLEDKINSDSGEIIALKAILKEIKNTKNISRFSLKNFINTVQNFQNFHKSRLICELLPADLAEEKSVKKYVLERINEHKMFRIYLTVMQQPEEFLNLLKAMEAEIKKLEK